MDPQVLKRKGLPPKMDGASKFAISEVVEEYTLQVGASFFIP